MLKIVITLLLVLCLGACSDQLEKAGYTKEQIEMIHKLKKEDQRLFLDSYRQDLLMIIESDDFQLDKMDDYLKNLENFGLEDVVTYVNRYNEKELMTLKKLVKDPYFIKQNVDMYLENLQDSTRKTVEYINTLSYLKPYEDICEADISKDIHVLVNKYYFLGPDYIPNDLVTIERGYGIDGQLRKMAYDAYVKMSDDANKEGLSFYITSPFRPYSSQERLYNNYCKNHGKESADTFSARPGFSEHQTGLVVDILTHGSDFDTFEKTDEAKWLKENAHKYGFILRYPKESEAVTGYMYEPWHFRYVGDIAEDIYRSNLTFDEYYAYYLLD